VPPDEFEHPFLPFKEDFRKSDVFPPHSFFIIISVGFVLYRFCVSPSPVNP